MSRILVLYGSHRTNGNTEFLADKAVEGIKCTKIYLNQKEIRPIDDYRHDEMDFPDVPDDYQDIIKEVINHDVVVFATPVYWYGLSGRMKNFVDRWSQSLRDKSLNFKQSMAAKKAYVITTGGDNPRLKGLPLIQQFQYILQFVGTEFAGYIIGEGNQPGDIQKDGRALFEAKELNARLKELR